MLLKMCGRKTIGSSASGAEADPKNMVKRTQGTGLRRSEVAKAMIRFAGWTKSA